jgi:hypothetical protein
VCHMAHPSHPPHDVITLIMFGKVHKLWSTSLHRFLQSSATSSLIGPNSPLSTLFSNIFCLKYTN